MFVCYSRLLYTYDQTNLRAATCIILMPGPCRLANFINLLVITNKKKKYAQFSVPRIYTSSGRTSPGPGAVLRFCRKMLAVFEKAIGNPPEELSLPSTALESSKSRQETAEIFQSLWPQSTLYHLSNANFMALSHEDETPLLPRSIVVMDDIFCIFLGTLENMSELKRHYGLSRQATEAMVLIEAYKTLRDRAPYPPDQVIKDLQGKFAFVLFDARSVTLFAARDGDGSVDFKWGIAGDGSLVLSNDPNIIREACGKSCSPFPPGCIFMNGSGLTSFVHPLHKVRAILREDDDGKICGVTFQVDLYTRLHSIPRTGSAANWANAAVIEAD